MKKNIIVKDNALINASYQLDLVEQRLILLAIVKSRQTNEDLSATSNISINASDYMSTFKVVKSTAYQALKDACKSLFSREFSYIETMKNGKQKTTQSRWVSEISYIDEDATVELFFAPSIIPFISNLEKRFTSYELEQVSNLTSSYATRLYEILIAWKETKKTPTIMITDLRNRLGIEESKYIKMTNFKARVLDLSIQQINKHTDITISYKQQTSGRKILGFVFFIKIKQNLNSNTFIQKNALPGESWKEAKKRLNK